MELEKIAEKIRDLVVGEIKEEFRDFKASVTGELSGFRLAIESLNARQGSMEARQSNIENELRDIRRSIDEMNKRIDDTNKRIDDTNKKIDELRVELKAEIYANTARIDETNKRLDDTNKRIDDTNKRIDSLYLEVSEIRGDLKKALSDKEIVHDFIRRIERLETKVFA
ncbi:MAG: coiled-coil domain-containing protein [Thermodesulfovibrionales bacterium]